eukprot:TRINITY_DN2516_c0_g1_i3.p1 TRINITY_DN2516_c0_g1~~TRINITY_DN2516_c0_g1_i3.p1  ORF type:complete len:105 (+),score=20.25 TRINITY_DN2516_c0_g1_i3:43-315(+)
MRNIKRWLGWEEVVSVQALVSAAAKGNVLQVTFLLDQGVNVNGMCDGTTPLHLAAENGRFSVVQLLIDRGSDVNAKQDNNNGVISQLHSC